MSESIEQVIEQRDAYSAALHTMVNAVRTTQNLLAAHLSGDDVDFVWLHSLLSGDVEYAEAKRASVHRGPSSGPRDRKADQAYIAVVECVHILQLLDALAQRPGEQRQQYASKISLALSQFDRNRDTLIELLYGG